MPGRGRPVLPAAQRGRGLVPCRPPLPGSPSSNHGRTRGCEHPTHELREGRGRGNGRGGGSIGRV
eukprot:3650262-Pyramimonas_sp.AAC.1